MKLTKQKPKVLKSKNKLYFCPSKHITMKNFILCFLLIIASTFTSFASGTDTIKTKFSHVCQDQIEKLVLKNESQKIQIMCLERESGVRLYMTCIFGFLFISTLALYIAKVERK